MRSNKKAKGCKKCRSHIEKERFHPSFHLQDRHGWHDRHKHVLHMNDHEHSHNHSHEHLQEHAHEHNQTHLHVEEHDHVHEHEHHHKHNHLHGKLAHNLISPQMLLRSALENVGWSSFNCSRHGCSPVLLWTTHPCPNICLEQPTIYLAWK